MDTGPSLMYYRVSMLDVEASVQIKIKENKTSALNILLKKKWSQSLRSKNQSESENILSNF